MSTSPVAPVSMLSVESVQQTLQSTTSPSGTFENHLTSLLKGVNSTVLEADAATRAVAVGNEVSLHRTMVSLESARLSMSLVVQVRNRLVESYQELMRMQL